MEVRKTEEKENDYRPSQFSAVFKNGYGVAIFVRAIIATACVAVLLIAAPSTPTGAGIWLASTLLPFILGIVGMYTTMRKLSNRYRGTRAIESRIWSVKWMALMNGWPIYGTQLAMIGFSASPILFFLSLTAIGFAGGITLGELCAVHED